MSWFDESNYDNNTCKNSENVVEVQAFRKMQRLGTKLGFSTKMSAKSSFIPNYFGL
jgi:hypothetical protein